MFTSFFAWLKTTFSSAPTIIDEARCSNSNSCQCSDASPVVTEVAVAEVAPVKKSRKPRTPKV